MREAGNLNQEETLETEGVARDEVVVNFLAEVQGGEVKAIRSKAGEGVVVFPVEEQMPVMVGRVMLEIGKKNHILKTCIPLGQLNEKPRFQLASLKERKSNLEMMTKLKLCLKAEAMSQRV